jgi:hypothetical protein
MEKMVSFFPLWMIRKSPLRDEYFDRCPALFSPPPVSSLLT